MPPEHTTGSHQSREGGNGSRIDRLLAELDAVEFQLWIVVVAALVLDVYLTYRGLQRGYVEGNPVMAIGMEHLGFAALGLAKAGALGVGRLCRAVRPEYGPVIALGLAIPWVGAVVVNSIHLAPVF